MEKWTQFSRFCLCVFVSIWSSSSDAQSIKSGLRGKMTIASKLLSAKEWPVQPDNSQPETAHGRSLDPARVRRVSPYGHRGTAMEPNPSVLLVVDGFRGENAPDAKVTFEGLRFFPEQVLVVKPGRLFVTNRHSAPLSLALRDGENQIIVLKTIEPRATEVIPGLPSGPLRLFSKKFPFAEMQARVMDKALVIPVGDDGTISAVPIESGDYRLALYHGARPLSVVPLTIPNAEYVMVVGSVSELRTVSFDVKDGRNAKLAPTLVPSSQARPAAETGRADEPTLSGDPDIGDPDIKNPDIGDLDLGNLGVQP